MLQKNHNFMRMLLTFLVAVLFILNTAVYADDAEAQTELEKAKTAYAKGDYSDAAAAYKAAQLYADSADIKMKAIEKAADAYGKAGMKYKQFQCLEQLIEGFPDRIDFEKVITQEYKIGNEFTKGHRDLSLSWLPWIKDKNRAPEIYETILRQAPFAKFAPELKLRLGRMYIADGKNKQALATFRKLIKQHPKSKEAKYARFELANSLVQLSIKAGDGDGSYAREAEDVLNETLKIYPKDSETLWIKESIKETDDVRAKRLYNLAKFYKGRKNPEAATRYFNDLIARFPDSDYVDAAEKQLAELDKDYKPKDIKKSSEGSPYPILKMQDERQVILIAPEASGGKWLLPIEDLDTDSVNADGEYTARKHAEEEAKKKAEAKRKIEMAARKAVREKLEAEQKAKKKAEEEELALKQKEEEEQLRQETAEKTRKLQEEAEKLAKEKTEAEKLAKEKAEAERIAKEKTEAERKKKEAEEAARKKAEEENRKKEEKLEKIKIDPAKQKESSNQVTYLILIIIAILGIVGGIIYFAKKKK